MISITTIYKIKSSLWRTFYAINKVKQQQQQQQQQNSFIGSAEYLTLISQFIWKSKYSWRIRFGYAN